MAGYCEVFHNRSPDLSVLICSNYVYVGFDRHAAEYDHEKQRLLLCEYSAEQSR